MRTLGRDWSVTRWPEAPSRLAIFADTLSQVDGVSIWCRRFLERAARDGAEVFVPHCGPVSEAIRDARTERFFTELPEIGGGSFPAYAGLRLSAPSFVHTLAWLQKHAITQVELATPGPFGLCGLLAAKLLRIPARATYHTELPELVRLLTGQRALRALGLHVHALVLRSGRARHGVLARGPRSTARVRRVRRRASTCAPWPSIPTSSRRSTPTRARASGSISRAIVPSCSASGGCRGRRTCPSSSTRWRGSAPSIRIRSWSSPATVPNAGGLEELAAGRGDVRFVGQQTGIALRQLYARASAFVFASEIDTLGLVAMEAMSSGVPLLVPRGASIADLVEHRRSAYVYDLDAAALAEALARGAARSGAGRDAGLTTAARA